ncbi:hypothetical protein B0H14DRAFT_2767765 [Mycena olivaceomarginata]|nr:hypothetical protein B0H14DRAFT_2823826 [Mycena olivaceomarginata]KAJ7848459.1 hypothetical protein B0H14DRAFT_2767765 [Mycena olivaceomarginata]
MIAMLDLHNSCPCRIMRNPPNMNFPKMPLQQTSQVDNNIRDCFETFIAVYPHVSNTLETKSGCAEVLAGMKLLILIPLLLLSTAICICAEQTFTQASAKKQAFSAAFATALNAYHGSDLESNVNNSIARFSSQDYEEVDGPRWDLVKKVVPKLLEIIKAHRLRI